MKRKFSIPYGETTVLSLLNVESGTKFQLIAKVRSVEEKNIKVTDDHEVLELEIEGEDVPALKAGDTIIIFGEKMDSGFRNERILKLNFDWDLYKKTRELELK
ncbi:MAG: hypothetical protein ACFFB2_05430 [Promethearchaeota archaeon]